jgi:hypothetical protein
VTTHPDRSARLARRWAIAVALIAGFLVWNVVFDLWLGQGERQYLWERAKHEMGRGRDVSLKGSMEVSIRDGAMVATCWAALVVAAVLSAAYLAFRLGRRDPTRPGD